MRLRVDRGSDLLMLITIAALAMRSTAHGQESPKPDRPAPLARYFPRKDLVVYAEFDGLDKHREAWNKSATYRLLTETATGAMLEHSIVRLLDRIVVAQSPVPARGRELVDLGKHLLRSGFAIGINRAGGVGLPRCLALVIRGGATGASRTVLDRFLRAGEGPRNPVKRVDKPGGRQVQMLGNSPPKSLAWWSEGDDLVVSLASPTGVDAIIATLDGREPNAVDHPTRMVLSKADDAPGFLPVGLAFFEMTALPPLPREARAMGLDRIKRFDYRWGFHGPAIQSIIGAVVPSPRTGIPALFDQPTFDVHHLPPLPAGLTGFTVLSLDAARSYDQVSAIAKAMNPRAAQPLAAIEASVQQMTGLKLRDDLLAPLGSRVVIYTVPTKINAPPNVLAGLAHALVFAPRLTVVIDVKDHDAVARAIDSLAKFPRQPAPINFNAGPTFSFFFNTGSMKKLKGPDFGYIFTPSSSGVTLPMGMRPTLLLGRNELVWGMTPATARRARDLAEGPEAAGLPSDDPLLRPLVQLPDRLTFLNVADTRQSLLPEALVGLPNLIQSSLVLRSPPFQILPFQAPVPSTVDVSPTPPFDPELIPEPDEIRPFLFPSVSVLAVNDSGIQLISREAFPSINPATVVPIAIAMIVPALRSSQFAAQRAQSTNNLKQIGLALANYESANGHFPADIRGKDGKPLLSWRVQILPYIEQVGMFNEFKLDEPWDGPHNKALLDRMPEVFALPGNPADPGQTFYRGFSGKRAFFDPKTPEGVKIASILDGTSNTIDVVEAREAVPWTRPDSDIPAPEDLAKVEQLQALREALGGHGTGGFNALFCDGSVRFIKDSTNLITLGALITRDGGEVVSSDSF